MDVKETTMAEQQHVKESTMAEQWMLKKQQWLNNGC